jgi:hypothetical protein
MVQRDVGQRLQAAEALADVAGFEQRDHFALLLQRGAAVLRQALP